MQSEKAIITINIIPMNICRDIEVPLDISAVELCNALYETYLPNRSADVQQCYLKAERPIMLLRGDKTLREYGLRDGSIINITE